ncbi:MAG: VWA domain-containing protein [Myxococcales bacterium]|nr:VWA domain-containing protein [Myxococcales bacterium]
MANRITPRKQKVTQSASRAQRRFSNGLRWSVGLSVALVALTQVGACSPSGGSPRQVGDDGGSGNSGGSGTGGFINGGNGGTSNGGDGFGGSLIDGGGANGGSGGQDACASDTYGGKQLPLDMYIVLDRSGSMDGTSWDAVKSAITTFVQSPDSDGIGVGMQFFPVDGPACPLFPPCDTVPGCTQVLFACEASACDPNDYLPPAVNLAPLPGVASQIVNKINNTTPNGGTPTMPALQSAAQAMTSYAAQNPTHKVIIVLASDGAPTDCETDINKIASVAAAAAASNPPVLTYTIGIGDIAALDTIAAAGGSQKAIVVDTAQGGQDFLDAMNEIRGQALGCEYLMPTPSEGDADPDKLNVRYTPDGSAEEVIPRVSDASQCQGQAGWYYDDPANPSKIILCPSSCDRVKNLGGSVNIELGCEQIVAPPR